MEGTLIGGGTRKRSSALGREEEEEVDDIEPADGLCL